MKNNNSEQITEKDFLELVDNDLPANFVSANCFNLAQKMVEQSKGSKGSGYKKVLIKENGNPINKDNHILKFYDTNQGQRYFNFEKKFWEKELSGKVEWYYEQTALPLSVNIPSDEEITKYLFNNQYTTVESRAVGSFTAWLRSKINQSK